MSIVAEKIEKIFKKKRVLKDISLTAEDGEILGLIGPVGAGKTTLIRLLTGAIKADNGKITIDGVALPERKLLKQIGFMPQADALYSDLSGLDNLKFFGRLYGLSGKKLIERCNEMLRFIGLYDDMDKLVSDYSGDMKKRLSLIIALLHDPKYLILDEPTADIGPILRKKIWEKFSELAAEGKNIIISTHVLDEVTECTKCALLNEGKLIAFGTAASLLQSAKNGGIEELFFSAEGENK